MRTLAILSVLLVGSAMVRAADIPLKDRTIVVGERVGPVKKGATLSGLKKLFGADKVKPYDVGIGEGETVAGARLFDGTGSELHFIFREEGDKKVIAEIRVEGKDWIFQNGLKTGMTVEEVEKINGKPYSMSAFGVDYGGTANFEGGLLETLSIRFDPGPGHIPDHLIGEQHVSSTDPVLRKNRPVVADISILFPLPPEPEEAPGAKPQVK